MIDPRTPVIVGTGQLTNRRSRAVHPLHLLEEAARLAASDARADVLPAVRSVLVPGIISHHHPAYATALAERLGLASGERLTTTTGGQTPQWLVARACDDIASGRIDAVLIAGAEAGDSGKRGGPNPEPNGTEDAMIGDRRLGPGPVEMATRVAAPATMYAMAESILAHHAGRTPGEQREWLGRFMAPFTHVAASHPELAWFPSSRSPAEISGIDGENRLVCEPYTKMLNAILTVDMGAALVLMSAEAADAAGVPRDRWVFPWAAADCTDVFYPCEREDLARTPALRAAVSRALDAAGVGLDDIATFDLYSCFPSAVQLACAEIGLSPDDRRGLTVTGGLPYFGGPGNNYVSHSIGITVQRCRENHGAMGMTTGMGWYFTKHAAGLYSSEPPPRGWRHPDCSDEQTRIEATAVPVDQGSEGDATVEAMTIFHHRERGALSAPIYARRPDGSRVVANAADPGLPAALSGTSLIGSIVRVRPGEAGPLYEPA
jgi:acetyl-CoA C-acetyltransferase